MLNDTLNPLIGIDLGTTFCSVAAFDSVAPADLRNNRGTGSAATQSALLYNPDQNRFEVGDAAFFQGQMRPHHLVTGVKRHMDSPIDAIDIEGRKFNAVDLSAILLKHLVETHTNGAPGFSPRGCVVTVPYYFTANQIKHTRDAAEQAGLILVDTLAEPIAAALSVALQDAMRNINANWSHHALIFDLGGGTFDCALLKVTLASRKLSFQVLSVDGDARLGGLDFDEALLAKFTELAQAQLGHPKTLEFASPRLELHFRKQHLEAARKAKIELTEVEETDVAYNYLAPGVLTVRRSDLESALQPFMPRIKAILDRIMAAATEPIEKILLVGGSSEIPCIRDLIRNQYGVERVWNATDPGLCVSRGAAIYAAYKENPANFGGLQIEIGMVTSHAFGVRAQGTFQVIVPKGSPTNKVFTAHFRPATDFAPKFKLVVLQGRPEDPVAQLTEIGAKEVDIPAPGPRDAMRFEVQMSVQDNNLLNVIILLQGQRLDGEFGYA